MFANLNPQQIAFFAVLIIAGCDGLRMVAFLTPIGHHSNLLVYGPGHYRFSDFVKVGTPICALVIVVLAPLIWRS